MNFLESPEFPLSKASCRNPAAVTVGLSRRGLVESLCLDFLVLVAFSKDVLSSKAASLDEKEMARAQAVPADEGAGRPDSRWNVHNVGSV